MRLAYLCIGFSPSEYIHTAFKLAVDLKAIFFANKRALCSGIFVTVSLQDKNYF